MADSFRSDFGLPTWLTAGISAIAVGLVIIGGIKRIGSFASKVMPSMALLYFVAAITVLTLNAGEIPAAFATIIAGALSPQAALAGFSGATVAFTLTWGVKRGLFSNEAGQGSAPIAHAAAKTDEPVREGAVALLEPFIDTLIICTLTGLMIVTTGVWHDKKESVYPLSRQSAITVVPESCRVVANAELKSGDGGGPCTLRSPRITVTDGRLDGARLVINHGFVDGARILDGEGRPITGTLLADPGLNHRVSGAGGKAVRGAKVHGMVLQNGSPLTAWALQKGLAPLFPFGSYIVTIAVFLFALSTAIGWSYYGDRSIQYLVGERAVLPYKLVFVLMHFVGGAVASLEGIWGFGDTALGLMSFPNLIAIVLLSGQVSRLSREYFSRDHVPFSKRK